MTASIVFMIVGTALISMTVNEPLWGMVHFLVFGALHGGVYTAGMAILGAQFRGADLASGSSTFGVTWGASDLTGPALGGLATRAVPEIGVPLSLALFLFSYLPLLPAAVLR